jgi:hypothetical protein
MPTREQMETVVGEVEIWRGGLNVLPIEDKHGVPAAEGRRFLFWDEMTEDYRRHALASEIDWEGFTEGQKDNVIRRVLDGQVAESWMDGITASRPSYQVWHANDLEAVHQSRMERAPYVHGYTHVADVEARNLQHAAGLTVHTDRDWWLKPEVKASVVGSRDTAADDVIVDPQGRAYRYEGYQSFREVGAAILDAGVGEGLAPDKLHAVVAKAEMAGTSPTLPSSITDRERPPSAAVSDYARTLDATARRARQRDPDRGIDR